MNNRNVKVIDEHNIDRNASIMFAMDLNGSEYVVYWIERDETSNNVFVSKVLKNLDGTYNMLNIDDADKKREVSDVVKYLISSSVSDQNDKLVGVTKALTNGGSVKFIGVSFNKEQNINVTKTYITTVKKEVTKVVEDYYDVVPSEMEIETVLTPVVNTEAPVVSPAEVKPEVVETITNVVPTPVETPVVPEAKVTPEVTTPVVEVKPESVVSSVETTTVVMPEVITPIVEVAQPTVTIPTPVETPVATPELITPIVETQPTVVATPVIEPIIPVVPEVKVTPEVTTPVVEVKPEPVVVTPTPVVTEPILSSVDSNTQPLVFNAAKETNLNAALGEVANSNTIPVENINVVREFGEETPVVQAVEQPVVAPMTQVNNVVTQPAGNKSGFANSKFFMVVAIAFFVASCVFLGYEVYNYFQITK